MSKNNLNDHVTQNLKQSIYKVLEEGPTSERNLQQFRERMAANRAAREERAKEFQKQKAAEAAARNTPQAKAERAKRAEESKAKQAEFARTHPNAGKISYNPNSKASINPDGSFNISPQQQAQAQVNRDAVAAGRAQDAERTARLGVPPQQAVQGYDASGRTIKPNPNFKYVNPNSPEGRIEASIAAGNEPDLPRDSSGRIVTNAKGVQDPNAVGYAAGQAEYDKSLGFSTAGMSQQQIRDQVRQRVATNTQKTRQELESSIPKPVTQQ